MQITLNITEDSKVELVKDNCELVQGECCFTDFVFNFPATIKGHAIGEYAKSIEFAECKELGECVKFVDEIKGDKYELDEMCTAFKKIMVQIVLERVADGKKITWKTVPFTLEFAESVNANGTAAVQAQLLSLTEIKNGWEAFIKANTLRMVYSSGNVATADASSNGDTIFYLGENIDGFTYGHYYRCVYVGGAYSWTDLTQDPSLEGVANGIKEINKNRTMQVFVGNDEEIENATHGDNVIYIDEDKDATEVFDDVLTAMAQGGYIPIDGGNKKIPLVENTGTGGGIVPEVSPTDKIMRAPLVFSTTITMGGLTEDGDDWDRYEITCADALYPKERLYYDGEDAEVDKEEDGILTLWVRHGGKFASLAQGAQITVTTDRQHVMEYKIPINAGVIAVTSADVDDPTYICGGIRLDTWYEVIICANNSAIYNKPSNSVDNPSQYTYERTDNFNYRESFKVCFTENGAKICVKSKINILSGIYSGAFEHEAGKVTGANLEEFWLVYQDGQLFAASFNRGLFKDDNAALTNIKTSVRGVYKIIE